MRGVSESSVGQRGENNAGKEGREGNECDTNRLGFHHLLLRAFWRIKSEDGNAKMYLKNVYISSNLHEVFEL